jgi:hypothetical protein
MCNGATFEGELSVKVLGDKNRACGLEDLQGPKDKASLYKL